MAATDWKGYLLKFGNVEVPLSYLKLDDGNEQTPNQREEISAKRDDYTRKLSRVTADGKITKMSFVFRPLNITQMRALRTVMANGLVNAKERKYNVTYWNDENLRYERGYFYIPDITYKKGIVDASGIMYKPFTMTLIGYETSEEVNG